MNKKTKKVAKKHKTSVERVKRKTREAIATAKSAKKTPKVVAKKLAPAATPAE